MHKIVLIHRRDAENAEKGIFPAERLQSWPEEVLWRIGIYRFSINNLPLCELSVPNESCFQRDKWAVKFDTTYLLL